MLTSRNEYRLLHRQDNAQERFSPIGHALGLVSSEICEGVRSSRERVVAEVARLERVRVQGQSASKLLCRPGMRYQDLVAHVGAALLPLSTAEQQRVEIEVKYAAYIERARRDLEARAHYETLSLAALDFARVPGLSNEGREALSRQRPASLAAAARVRGIRDSDLSTLLVHLKARAVSRETV